MVSRTGSLQYRPGLKKRLSLPQGELAVLAGILVAALAVRLALLPIPGYKYDVLFFTNWGNTLTTAPWDSFYDVANPPCEYLPGYMYILAGTGFLKKLLSGGADLSPASFEAWMKLGTITADLVLAVTAYRLCRRFTGPKRALAAAALVAFNPATMFVGAVWGQVDSIAVAFSFLALLSLISGRPTLAAVLAGLGFLVKPQYSLFLAVAGVAYLRSEVGRLPSLRSAGAAATWASWVAQRVVLPLAALAVVVESLLLPFSVSIWPSSNAAWTLQERMAFASRMYPFASPGAFNFWSIHLIKGLRKPDNLAGWLSVSYQSWGLILLATVVLAAGLLVWRRPEDPVAVLWSCFVVAFGFFEVATRIHERYLFAAIPLIGTVAVFMRWALPVYLGLTGFYLLNLWYVWAENQGYIAADFNLGYWASDFGAILFVVSLAALVVMMAGSFKRTSRASAHQPNMWASSSAGKILAAHAVVPTIPYRCRRAFSRRAGATTLAIFGVLLAGFVLFNTVGADDTATGAMIRTATIRAYESWQDTGVRVEAGDDVSIAVMGEWSNQKDGDLYGPGGDGNLDSGTIMPSAPVGIMLGRIGNSSPFVVGERADFTADASGPLQLVMNDWPPGHGDNRGRVDAVISIAGR